ncbi:MAG: hypothetical protein JSV16_07890 [Candidatus Hydrogenedentota bacterium]|nr:MAG: hypothetical protein JSV16_07890 [Candidatus Hydrogenedentota bacterium]
MPGRELHCNCASKRDLLDLMNNLHPALAKLFKGFMAANHFADHGVYRLLGGEKLNAKKKRFGRFRSSFAWRTKRMRETRSQMSIRSEEWWPSRYFPQPRRTMQLWLFTRGRSTSSDVTISLLLTECPLLAFQKNYTIRCMSRQFLETSELRLYLERL